MFKSILSPVDFSEHSERALRCALDLSALTGAHLHIMTAIDPFLEAASQAAGHHDVVVRQTQEELDKLLARISADPAVLRERPAIVVIGEAAEEILKQITECGSDLVVMGTQGLGAARRLVFGSTTDRVLRESPVPVLAIPLPR